LGSSLDAVFLQQRGATALPLLTRPFVGTVERISRYWKMDRELPVVAVDHPIQNVSAQELERRAEQIADEVASYFERGRW
jgi:hypothetical protein